MGSLLLFSELLRCLLFLSRCCCGSNSGCFSFFFPWWVRGRTGCCLGWGTSVAHALYFWGTLCNNRSLLDAGKGGLSLRGVSFMTVLESTLPPSCFSCEVQCQETTVTVLAVVAVSVVTATPLKLTPLFRRPERVALFSGSTRRQHFPGDFWRSNMWFGGHLCRRGMEAHSSTPLEIPFKT